MGGEPVVVDPPLFVPPTIPILAPPPPPDPVVEAAARAATRAVEDAATKAATETERALNEQRRFLFRREIAGYTCVVLGVLGVLGFVARALCTLGIFVNNARPPEFSAPQRDVFLAAFGAEAVVVIAGVYFCYRLIAMGKSLLWPLWAGPEDEPDGVLHPVELARQAGSAVLDRVMPKKPDAKPS